MPAILVSLGDYFRYLNWNVLITRGLAGTIYGLVWEDLKALFDVSTSQLGLLRRPTS